MGKNAHSLFAQLRIPSSSFLRAIGIPSRLFHDRKDSLTRFGFFRVSFILTGLFLRLTREVIKNGGV